MGRSSRKKSKKPGVGARRTADQRAELVRLACSLFGDPTLDVVDDYDRHPEFADPSVVARLAIDLLRSSAVDGGQQLVAR